MATAEIRSRVPTTTPESNSFSEAHRTAFARGQQNINRFGHRAHVPDVAIELVSIKKKLHLKQIPACRCGASFW